jgi:hypothetical protein
VTEIPQGQYDIKGTWNTSVIRLRNGESTKIVILSCPSCGRDISLSGRLIDKDGAVSGAVMCQREGCRWKDEIKLVHWGSPL